MGSGIFSESFAGSTPEAPHLAACRGQEKVRESFRESIFRGVAQE